MTAILFFNCRFIKRTFLSRSLLPQFSCNIRSVSSARPLPINDFSNVEASKYSENEKRVRCELASLYRVVDMKQWNMGIYNHITARLGGDEREKRTRFLVNMFGLLYDEVTASNLVSVDLAGRMLEPGSLADVPVTATSASTEASVNLAGYILHSAIHSYREDLMCIIHVHIPEIIAVASMSHGLLPLSQEAVIVLEYGGVGYHDYQGILIRDSEKCELQQNLGPNNKVLFLRNHGVVVCGASIEEAYLLMDTLVTACRTQVALGSCNSDNIVQISGQAQQNIAQMRRDRITVDTADSKRGRGLHFGQQDFEAVMRQLDRAGLKSGYNYRKPHLLAAQYDAL